MRSANGKLIKRTSTRIPHDFRRTAVRNLERAGVSRSDAMKMVGHKTEAIYRRYAIADERSMKESALKLDQFQRQKPKPQRQIGSGKVMAKQTGKKRASALP